jgi:hypothetical protein
MTPSAVPRDRARLRTQHRRGRLDDNGGIDPGFQRHRRVGGEGLGEAADPLLVADNLGGLCSVGSTTR